MMIPALASQVTVADAGAATTVYPMLANPATGIISPVTKAANWSFNASTGNITLLGGIESGGNLVIGNTAPLFRGRDTSGADTGGGFQIEGGVFNVVKTNDAGTVTATLATINLTTGATALAGNLSGTGAWSITGGAGNMTITSGTGNSRTMVLRTTDSGGTATTALTLGADQSATFAGTLSCGTNAFTCGGASVTSVVSTGTIQISNSAPILHWLDTSGANTGFGIQIDASNFNIGSMTDAGAFTTLWRMARATGNVIMLGSTLTFDQATDVVLTAGSASLSIAAAAFTCGALVATTGAFTGDITQNSDANGAQCVFGRATELLTLSTAVGSNTATSTSANLLPAGAIIDAVLTRVTTTITSGGTVTTMAVGDPTTAGRFSAAATGITANSTRVGIDQWSGAVTTLAAGPSQAAAAKVTITMNNSTALTAGVVRITVFYRQFVAPTS